MPSFDFRHIKIGEYTNTAGVITYATPTLVGDAITANLELRFAEGRLYAESKLAEYLKLATGGTISIGTKYIKENAKKMMYGCTEKTRSVGETDPIVYKSLDYTAKDVAKYVGCGFYAPDMIDGVQKYTCVFVKKCLFGPPAMAYQTKGETIVFQTPTTTGEFLADDTAGVSFFETYEANTEAKAIAWIDLLLGVTD